METRLLARLQATARTVTAPGAVTPVREVASNEAQALRAQVGARLADGTFRVLVDGRAPLRLALPAGVKPGDLIEIRVVNRHGRPHAEYVGSRAAEGGALSSAGRLISSLLSEEPAPAPQPAKSILPGPPAVSSELTGPLARALAESGLFYESHQARWVEGDYPLERLLREPQAQLGGASTALPAARGSEAARATPALPLATEGAAAGEPSAEIMTPSQPRAADEAQQPIARELLALVRNQLETLDSRQLTWLGELWPGQPLRWEVGADDGGHEAPEGQPGWRTRLALELPQLGGVDADLALAAGGVRLTVRAHAPHAAELMRSCAPMLVQSLTAAGISPVHVQIACDEPAS